MVIDKKNGNNILIADSGQSELKVYTQDGTFIKAHDFHEHNYSGCSGVKVLPDGNIVVVNHSTEGCIICDPQFKIIKVVRRPNANRFNGFSVGIDRSGNIIVPDFKGQKIYLFTSKGEFIQEIQEIGVGMVTSPSGVVCDDEGNLIISDYNGEKVVMWG